MKINKRIAISFITIAGVLTAVVGITLAQFSDDAALAGNTLSTGNAALRIGTLSSPTGNCGNYDDTSIPGVSTSNLAPGQSGYKYFCLRNESSSDITLKITAQGSVPTGDLDPTLVEVRVKCVDPEADPTPLDDLSGSIVVALNGVPGTDQIVLIPKGSTVAARTSKCRITQIFSESATNSASNKNMVYDVTFTGTQVGL